MASLDELVSALRDEDIGDKTVFTLAQNKCKGFKTSFRNKWKTASTAVQALEDAPNAYNVEYADTHMTKFKASYETLSDRYAFAIIVAGDDAANLEAMETRVSDAGEAFDELEQRYLAARTAAVPAQAAMPGVAPGAAGLAAPTAAALPTYKTNYNDALKPFRLELDQTPAELRSWVERLKAYFESNELERATPREQNQYVKQCISTEIDANIDPDHNESAMTDDTGIVALIAKLFTAKYSGFSRRLELATAKMKPGEAPMSYVGRMNKLYQEADLAAMTVDNYRVFFLLAGMDHKVLRTKILEMKDPTYESVVDKIKTWTITQSTSRSIAESLGLSETSQGGSVKMIKKRGGDKQEQPPSHIKITPASLKGRCYICGATNHEKDKCNKKTDAKCTGCGKENHLINVCLGEYIAWRRSRSGNQSGRGGKKEAKVKKVATEVNSDEDGGNSSDE